MSCRTRFLRVRRLVTAVLVVVAVASAGCDAEVSREIESCRDYRANSKFGRFTVQQQSKGSSMQWGTYPKAKYTGDEFVINPRLDGRKQDFKFQNYGAHGSVNANRARKYSGKLFRIDGTVRKRGKVVLQFRMQCRVL